jgi:hypothetical protein
LLSVDESVDAKIAPSCAVAVHIENEGRVFEVGKLFAVGVGFRDEVPGIDFDAQWKAGSRTISSVGSHCDL